MHAAFQLSKIGGGRRPPPCAPTSCCSGSDASAARWPTRSRRRRGQPVVRVVGLLDRSGYVFEPRGLSRRRLLDLAQKKDGGALIASLGGAGRAAEALTIMAGHAVSRPIIVDVTSEETGDLLRDGDRSRVQRRARQQEAAGRRLGSLRGAARDLVQRRAEGQIRGARSAPGCRSSTRIKKLVETGDRVQRIEGCVSGTLMFIMSAVSRGERFSDAVREPWRRDTPSPTRARICPAWTPRARG